MYGKFSGFRSRELLSRKTRHKTRHRCDLLLCRVRRQVFQIALSRAHRHKWSRRNIAHNIARRRDVRRCRPGKLLMKATQLRLKHLQASVLHDQILRQNSDRWVPLKRTLWGSQLSQDFWGLLHIIALKHHQTKPLVISGTRFIKPCQCVHAFQMSWTRSKNNSKHRFYFIVIS